MADDARLQVEISAKIDKLIDGLNKAGTKIDAFSRSAYGAADRVRKAFDIDQSRIDGPLKVIALQNQLTVAQAAGNAKEAGALKEQIALLSQINTLRRAGLSQVEATALAEKQVAAVRVAEAIARRAENGVNLGGAAKSIFDRARLGTIEEGTAKIGVFGRALEFIGPYGIAAAAGIIATTEALKQAHEAAEFADRIEDTAKKLHVTTDALQEYRYAVLKAGGTEQGADEALEGFSETLGKAEEGMKRSQRAFTALGFSRDEIKGFKDTDDALQQVIERLSQVRDNRQRDALIEQLGLKGMKPLIIEGLGALQRFRAEAQSIGIVMDGSLIKRGAEANKQFEVLSKVIDVQLKSAFVDLAPILVGILQLAAGIAREVADMVDGFRSIENRRTQAIRDRQGVLADALRGDADALRRNPNSEVLRQRVRAETAESNTAHAELARRAAADEAVAKPTGDRDATFDGGSGRGRGGAAPKDNTAEIARNIGDALAEAMRRAAEANANAPETSTFDARAGADGLVVGAGEYHDALGQLTGAYRRHADAEIEAIDDEAAHRANDRAAQIDKIGKLDDAAQMRAAADIALAAAFDATADAAKKSKVVFDQTQAQEAAGNEVYKAATEARIAALKVQADAAPTGKARADIEKEILGLEQQLARDLALTDLNLKKSQGLITPEQFNRSVAALGGQQGAEAATADRTRTASSSPFAQFSQDARDHADAGVELQATAVQAVDTLNSGLAEAVTQGKSFGDTLKKALQQAEGDLLTWGLKQLEGPALGGAGGAGGLGSIFGALLHFIPGFAGGTDSTPSGLEIVGEHGPELRRDRGGGQIIPNSTLAAFANGNIRAAPRSSGGTIVNHFAYDMRGVVTDNGLEQRLRASEARVTDNVRRSVPGWQVQTQWEYG